MTEPLTLSLSMPKEQLEEIIDARFAELQVSVPEPWIDVKGAAKHLACKPQRIYDLVSRRDESRLPHRKDGKRLLFRRSEFDAYLEANR